MLKQAEEVFEEYVYSPTSSNLLYNSMINAYAKCGEQEKAYLLYKQVTEEGHDLGAVGISIAVNSLTNGVFLCPQCHIADSQAFCSSHWEFYFTSLRQFS
ncbi:hypothetical protein RJT34_13000 [Clitoria ternatea]|uniref:Uncharacterized protein n=1 Tax=Clitoria ternatea TaxID=43366 RepID=A0AAN9PJU7_CLITE